MRRSSSVPKIPQSPRRVRFDFMGEEVLPTSSPQPSAFISPRIPSPEPADDETHCTSNLATDPGEETEHESLPRKVSSSDALRALSRTPLEEDGTVWTVVNSDSDDAETAAPRPDTAQSNRPDSTDAPISQTIDVAGARAFESVLQTKETQIREKANCAYDAMLARASNSSEEDSSDEDVLSMAKRKVPASRALYSSTATSSSAPLQQLTCPGPGNTPCSLDEESSPANQGRVPVLIGSEVGELEDDLFHFEDDELESQKPPVNSKLENRSSPVDQLSEDDDTDTPADAGSRVYATSPAVPIVRPVKQDEESSGPSRPRAQAGTVGSYRGRPLIMPVLRNPDILADLEAEVVKEIVGSVHDHNPMDSINMNNFSIDEGLALSAPRSFRERFVLEEMMEAAKAKQNGLETRQR